MSFFGVSANRLAMAAALLTAPLAAATDGRVGNGGYGVMVDGRLHSLDLAMRGVHVDPYLSEGVTEQLKPELQEILAYHLDRIVAPSVRALVERKLVELDKRAAEARIPYSVDGLVRNMDRYRWIALPDLTCTDVGDDHTPFPNKVQLAYRKDMWVRFCRDASNLPDPDLAALALHEIVYALHTEATTFVPQLVGLLFSDDFKDFRPTAVSELRAVVSGLSGAGDQPATLHWRLKTMFEASALPSNSEFITDRIWSGRCVGPKSPDALRGGLLFTMYGTDPIFGPIVNLVPFIAKVGTGSFENPTPEDLARFSADARAHVSEDLFTGVREPDFSWTGLYQNQYESNFGQHFQMRRTIGPAGEALYILKASNTNNSGYCYFNHVLVGD